jgi:predicted  nucleic acid-binding Zn-ribbon protein
MTDFPLSILDHRISTLRDRIAQMHDEAAALTGDDRAKLSSLIEAETGELESLVSERNILAADAR